MADTDIPDVDDTDLTREEMEELAGEYDIDPDGLDDQELLERLGVALGEIDEAKIRERNERRDEDRRSSLRGRFAARLEGAAGRLRPAHEDRDRAADEEAARSGDAPEPAADAEDRGGSEETRDAERTDSDEQPSEQRLPGEPIKGRTRNQLRDELRELGLPVTGTKAQLEQRLTEARSQPDSDAGGAGDDGGDAGASGDAGERDGHDHGSRMDRLRGKVSRRLHHGSDRAEEAEDDDAGAAGGADGADQADEADAAHDERLRDRVAEGLIVVAERLRASGQDDDASGASSRIKRTGAAVKRRLPLG